MKDKIKGGLADKKKPEDFDQAQLKMGIKVEMDEHITDKNKAREIAMDHLTEDPKYYTHLKAMEEKHGEDAKKYDRVDEEADGKKEFDVGFEELDKRWQNLKKKALENSTAIMDISEDNDDEEDGDSTEETDTPAEGEVPNETGETPQEGDGKQEGDGEQEGDVPPEEAEQRLIEALKQEGYDDTEIDYVVHGHTVPQPSEDDYATENERVGGKQDLQNDQRGADLDHEHKQRSADSDHDHQQRMNDVEYQRASIDMSTADPESEKTHKKRMMELEYTKAKAEVDLELKYKEKELEQKLRIKEETAKARKTESVSTTTKKK